MNSCTDFTFSWYTYFLSNKLYTIFLFLSINSCQEIKWWKQPQNASHIGRFTMHLTCVGLTRMRSDALLEGSVLRVLIGERETLSRGPPHYWSCNNKINSLICAKNRASHIFTGINDSHNFKYPMTKQLKSLTRDFS